MSDTGQGGVAKGRQELRDGAGSGSTGVLLKGDIPNAMETVFDGPVISGKLQQAFGACLFGRKAGDEINGFFRGFSGDIPLSDEFADLSCSRPCNFFRGDLDGSQSSLLDPTMPLSKGSKPANSMSTILQTGGKWAW